MTHSKSSEEELERLAQESSAEYFGGNSYVYDHVYAFKEGYRAAESETELLRKRVEKLRSALEFMAKSDEAGRDKIHRARAALADNKASETGGL